MSGKDESAKEKLNLEEELENHEHQNVFFLKNIDFIIIF